MKFRSLKGMTCFFVLGAILASVVVVSGCGTSSAELDAVKAEQVAYKTASDSGTVVDLAEVRRGDITSLLELTGNILPKRRTIIVSEVDGVVQSFASSKKKFEVEINGRTYSESPTLGLGDPVSKGDILVQIDPRDVELELGAAKASLLKAEMDLKELMTWKRPEEVKRLEAARSEAEARLQLSTSNLNRMERLAASRASTPSELDEARSEQRIARAALERAEAELSLATAGPTEAEIAVAESIVAQAQAEVEIKQETLTKTTIRAPYDGVITERFIDEGERISAQPRVEIMEIMDLSLVIVQIAIPERYLHRVQVNDWVEVKAQGVRDPVPGLIVLVNDKVDHETRTFRVRVALENLEGRFKPGQFVRADFSINSVTEALLVPSQALVYAGGQPQVFLFDNGRARLRPVQIGLSGDGLTEVVSGLAIGDPVVVDDPSILADGMLVQARAPKPVSEVQAQETRTAPTSRMR